MNSHLQRTMPWIGAGILAAFMIGVALGPILQVYYAFAGGPGSDRATASPFDQFDSAQVFNACKSKDTPFLFGPSGNGSANTHSQTGCWSAGWKGPATATEALARVEEQLKITVEKHGWRLESQGGMSIALPERSNLTRQFSCWSENEKRRGEIYIVTSTSADDVTTLTLTYTVPLAAN